MVLLYSSKSLPTSVSLATSALAQPQEGDVNLLGDPPFHEADDRFDLGLRVPVPADRVVADNGIAEVRGTSGLHNA